MFKFSNHSGYHIYNLVVTAIFYYAIISRNISAVRSFSPFGVTTSIWTRINNKNVIAQVHTSAVSNIQLAANKSENCEAKTEFRIRKATYGDLGKVSDLIVDSFYTPTPLKRAYLYLSELQRLQSNFPYSDPKHHFFVACTPPSSPRDSEIIVGFVDVDGRPSTMTKAPPRPYLSDLAVDSNFRRRGIAKALIKKCERVAKDIMKSDELYLRVERSNQPGLAMYKGLGYDSITHPVFGVEDTTALHKIIFTKEEHGETSNDNVHIVDYVV